MKFTEKCKKQSIYFTHNSQKFRHTSSSTNMNPQIQQTHTLTFKKFSNKNNQSPSKPSLDIFNNTPINSQQTIIKNEKPQTNREMYLKNQVTEINKIKTVNELILNKRIKFLEEKYSVLQKSVKLKESDRIIFDQLEKKNQQIIQLNQILRQENFKLLDKYLRKFGDSGNGEITHNEKYERNSHKEIQKPQKQIKQLSYKNKTVNSLDYDQQNEKIIMLEEQNSKLKQQLQKTQKSLQKQHLHLLTSLNLIEQLMKKFQIQQKTNQELKKLLLLKQQHYLQTLKTKQQTIERIMKKSEQRTTQFMQSIKNKKERKQLYRCETERTIGDRVSQLSNVKSLKFIDSQPAVCNQEEEDNEYRKMQ